MSYAIYGESDTYVFLVTSPTSEQAIEEFITDVNDVGVKLSHVYNIFAVNGREEDKQLEDTLEAIIAQAADSEKDM